MSGRIVLLAVVFAAASTLAAQEISPDKNQAQVQEATPAVKNNTAQEKKIKSYTINLAIRIFDDLDKTIVNSSWSRSTISGKPITINLKAGNLQIAAAFIPYYVDEKNVVLLAQGKVMLKPVNLTEGKYYSTVDSLPLKIGEKAFFLPLGLIDEKMENISSCVLEIEVQNCDKIAEECIEDGSAILETENQPDKIKKSGNGKNSN
ncbi:MAG: hypothetical protein RBT69_07020 [Spirochaetia bacterium]|jgi:hypothetical protein|nr:hypothetical protein [Spirochaetia bacterium]